MTGQIEAMVRDIELAEPLPAIPPLDAGNRRARRAHLLLRMRTEPLGTLLVDIPDAGLSATALASAIATELGRAGPVGTPGYVAGRAAAMADPPYIAVVICTRDHPDALARTIDSVLACDYPRMRLVIVDNAPRDDRTERVAAAAAERASVTYLREMRPGVAHARNLALAETAGEFVAWTDDDAVADRFWLAEFARAFADHPKAAIVTGPIIPAELDTPAQMWCEEFGGMTKGRGFTPYVFEPPHRQDPLYPLPPFGASANMALRPGVAESIGGFDPALGPGSAAMSGEDTLLFTRVLRAGGTIVYHPGAIVRHYHRRDVDGLRTQLAGYSTGLTAAYTSLVRAEPSALLGLIRLAPRALRDLYTNTGPRTAGIGAGFPRDLLRANRRGLLRGPFAYRSGRRGNEADRVAR